MFDKEVYAERRRELLRRLEGQKGIILFIGNVEAPAQYRDNCYKWRQDSTWLYFFGLDEPRFAAILDLESGAETIYADDYTIDDIVWMGPMPSVQSLAEKTGIAASAPYAKAFEAVKEALAKGRKVHTIPPSRYYNEMLLGQLGIRQPSEALIRAIVSLRLVKEPREIELIDAACNLGYEMHTIARNGIRPGVIEQEIVGGMEAVTLQKGWGVSFATILTQHGEIFHCHSHEATVVPGKLMVVDAGAESNEHYASDFTRTYPTGGKYTPRQKDIYDTVLDCNEYAFSLIKPGIAYRDVHIAVAERMLEHLRDLGLVSGNPAEMASRGVAGLFMPHGLGHNMGLDVHDMEDLGEDLVGYDDDQTRSPLPGLHSLRMARKLVPGNVITDEPGIYFIPDLIRKWKADGTDRGCVNYSKLEEYFDFGGIRIEDDVLVTPDGARRLGARRLPVTTAEIEEAMKQNNG
ncbi:MAG: aminopeptidase P N-terminal domain-containing protein [Bacteroidales bacterium]|nr:aminopeptidase P N-terminal domain-containing protein [Bacteroidales bacterium]